MKNIFNNNYKKEIKNFKPLLRKNTLQLTDRKKQNNGFDISESVIYVEQCGYGISKEDDVLFTYGIEPCCGLVLYDENTRVLLHLDGSVTPEDVIEITKGIGLQENATAVFAPGTACRNQGCFEYKKLEDEYRKIGYEVLEHRIPATLGFVTVSKNQIVIGSALDRSLDKTFSIEHKKSTQELGKEVLPELKLLVELKNQLKADLENKEDINKLGERNDENEMER